MSRRGERPPTRRTANVVGASASVVAAFATFLACGTDPGLTTPEGDSGADGSLEPAARDDADAAPIPPHKTKADTGAGTASPTPTSPPRTVVEIMGLDDFDFTDRRLAVRVAGVLSTCALPGCVGRTNVPNIGEQNGAFSIAGDRLYFSAKALGTNQDNVFSIAFDGTLRERRSSPMVAGGPASYLTMRSFAGGLTKVEQVVRWVRTDEAGYRTVVETTSGSSANMARVGRPTRNSHENFGAAARFVAEQLPFVVSEQNPSRDVVPASLAVTGASVPPVVNPEAIAVSPRGPGVAHPMVVVLESGILKACPTEVDCTKWIELGPLARAFNLDAENLYLGDERGLSKCSLEEIATQRTCTPKPMVSGEPVSVPMYLTDSEVLYRSRNKVRAVPKDMGVSCPPGAYLTKSGGVCSLCPAGQHPSVGATACIACSKGTYTDGPGEASCTPCAEGYTTTKVGSVAGSCVACPLGYESNEHTKHLCEPIPGPRVFVTAESHSADFLSDPSLVGASAIEKADAFCMRSATRPDGATYKAFLVDGVHRDASTGLDWVLKPNTTYFQVDNVKLIGMTNASAVFEFPLVSLVNPWASTPALAYAYFWTGIGALDWSAGNTCLGWTSPDAALSGNMGIPGRRDATGIGVGGATGCYVPLRVLCVEQ